MGNKNGKETPRDLAEVDDSPNNNTMSFTSYVRRPFRAGSWYQADAKELSQTLDDYMAAAAEDMPADTLDGLSPSPTSADRSLSLRAIMCPHAGYAYSGPTAAYSYKALHDELSAQLQQQQQRRTSSSSSASASPLIQTKTIVILHPSHHVYLGGCSVSGATRLVTPLGDLMVDTELRKELLKMSASGPRFTAMTQVDDEQEHSAELQFPFLAHILKQLNLLDRIKVLPVMCGALSVLQETQYGQAFSSILLGRKDVLTVVSTDFCHWGSRFQYQPRPPRTSNGRSTDSSNRMPIHEYIERLDRRGMDLIAAQTPGAFAEYLKETHNTICGRHAVAVWLRAVEAAAPPPSESSSFEIAFVKYAQSSAASSLRDSSVSYAAALATEKLS